MKKILTSLALVFALNSQAEMLVDDIRIEGLRKVPVENVIEILPIAVGDSISDLEISEVTSVIFNLGFFDQVVLEQKNISLEEEIARLQQQGVRDFEKLAREAQQMQLQLSEISGREQMTEGQLKNLQVENVRLMDELQNLQQRELDYNRQISLLNENNNNLLQQIESTQRLRLRLRNDIIGVIDQNDESPSR